MCAIIAKLAPESLFQGHVVYVDDKSCRFAVAVAVDLHFFVVVDGDQVCFRARPPVY